MKRTCWLWVAVSATVVLVLSLATRAGAERDESDTTATGKQRIVQIATAELPPKVDETGDRYILASMPGDTVAVLFTDNNLYAMRRNGTLERVEGAHGSRAFASVDRTAFAVCRNVSESESRDTAADPFPIEVNTFDSTLRPVSTMRISSRVWRTILSNDGKLVVGVGPITSSMASSVTSWLYRSDLPPRAVAVGHGGVAKVSALSSDGELFVLWGALVGILAYDSAGNKLWETHIGRDDAVGSICILETAKRIALAKAPGGIDPFNHKGVSLMLLDLKGNIVADPAPTLDYGRVRTDPNGEFLVRWDSTHPLRRIDPADGRELWRIDANEMGRTNKLIVTSRAILAFDWTTPAVKSISLDGEVLDRWIYPGTGEPWGLGISGDCQERFVTARDNLIYVCELREE
jgi:hypothetical protein